MSQAKSPSDQLILIVEDDANAEELLDHVIRSEGFQTAIARTGAEALAAAEKRAPSLIVMDLAMPQMNGFDAIRGLQTVCKSKVPIIINTARQVEPSTIDLLRAEANILEFLQKPTDYERLVRLIHTTLGTAPSSKKKGT